ncbi:MAG: chromosome segregation protein SMC [Defluviitaleaceae bacterium]|nr:chromosome segregation protein SMC [Defluviitaleaceae bacterium]MCL2261972.1 chromosome segregation protein SMC [Defluviitaleaceae bacterium]
MHLKKLELAGFKSFAERTQLSFGEGLNAVVGPNGSGKSNIADAMRWVLGEQSAKQLRGTKMEDIIFAGTAHRKPQGFAEIVMRIDNSDNGLDMNTPEVSVTRRVYRSGESEYAINGTPCRLKDIQQLFMDTGIGRDGYSIIGQGRVDEILSAKSEERRHIFEEAAGISKFKARRHETLTKLSREQQNRARVTDIIAELEEQMEPLEQQSEDARRYLALRDQYKETHINIFLTEVQKIETELEKTEEALTTALAQTADGKSRLALAREAEESLKTQAVEADSRYRRANETLLEATTAIEHKTGERNLLESQAEQLVTDQIRLRGEVDKRAATLIEREEERIREEEIREKAEATLANLNAQVESQQDRSAQFESEEEESAAALAAHNQEILAQGYTVSEYKAKVLDAENRYQRLEEDKEKLDANIEQVEENIEAQVKTLEELKEIQRTRTEEAEKADAQVEAYNRALIKLNNELQEIERDYRKAQESLTAARGKHRALSDLQNQHEGYYRSVKSILRKRETDPNFAGICGAVGELIGVPDGYEIAIEIALGGAAQNIITKTEDDAKRAIEFLKQSREGRATFLPLTAVKGRILDTARLRNEAGYIGVAADLVNCDNAYADVIAQLLGDIIIVDNLDNASAIHRKFRYSYKLVTLEGERLSPGGSMTGGSMQRGQGGIIGRPRQLSELAEQIISLERTFNALATARTSEANKTAATEEALHRARTRAQSLHVEAKSLGEKCDLVSQGLEALRQSSTTYNEENDAIMDKLVETNAAIRQAKQAQQEQERELDAANARLEDFQRRLAEKRTQFNEESDALTELRVEIGRNTEWKNAAIANISRLEREKFVLTEEKRTLLEEIESAVRKAEANKATLISLSTALSNLFNRQDEARNAVKSAEATKTQLDEAIARVEADERSQSDESSLLEKELTRLEMRKEQLHQNGHRLHNEIWEEYELTYQQALSHKRDDIDESTLRRESQQLRAELAALSGVNIGAIEAYKQVKTRHDFLSAQHDDILKAEEALADLIAQLTAQMEEQFLAQFTQITYHFNEVFREMFGGGTASLRLTDEANLLESGIEITAQPPGKALQTLLLLSGGERALTAIALLFAILRLKPSPFCVLDEIESALDDANVARFAKFLQDYSDGTQFIIITHRKGTMEAADHLYGVTMQEQGVSKLVSVKFIEDEAA